ncbi:MAG: hypothetical protein IPO07_14595 [Haliscomenobacter sp.]|nr:hypothetical protein [Haliscomenobacter sp.]MBK9489856.1 hypothetical protein [Haliscomenobacter sp.]
MYKKLIIDTSRPTQNHTYSKPYWDISLIKTFIESYGGKLNACPEGKGYDIIVPDAHRS